MTSAGPLAPGEGVEEDGKKATTDGRGRGPFGSSLSVRISLTISGVLTLVLGLFAFWVATQLTSDLFDARREAILEDAKVRFSQVQSALDQSTATTRGQVQEATGKALSAVSESAAGAGAVEVMLLRSPEASETFRINEFGSAEMAPVVSDEIRDMLAHETGYWQSVAYPHDGDEIPGILVGALVDVPMAGAYEMFILYSLESEQAAVNLVLRILFVGAVPILLLMGLLTFFLVYRMLRPVRAAATAATRLAEGDLESRVTEEGSDEMALLGRAFNDMASSLSQKINDYDALSKVQQSFVSDVSHELRTPMTTIRMAEEMIYEDRDELGAAGRRSAELLHSEVGRFEQMLADLLEISRFDARSQKLDNEQTDLYTLAAKVIAANQGLAERLGVEVILGERPERCSVPVDSIRVERVVRNLLVNAIEYSEGKPVEVTVASGETAAAIRVRDRGVGMAPDTARRVFDRFYRANPARTRTTGGTGLGLAIAKEDVALHNGVINVWGEPGKGSSFVVTFPREPLAAVTEFPLIVWEAE